MTARESIQTKLIRLRRQSARTGQVRLSATAVAAWAEAGVYFLLAAVLSGAVVLDGRAPFATALVGAAGPGIAGGAALVGACFGSLALLPLSDGLRYAAAAVLTFAFGFAFWDWKPLRRGWVMPVLTAAFVGFTGVITQSRRGWTAADIVCLGLELCLTGAAVWCDRLALVPAGRSRERLGVTASRRRGLLALSSMVVIALTPICLVGNISLGRICGGAAVLAAAWQGGTAVGAVAGVAMGAAMDLAGDGAALYTMILGLSGLTAGLYRGKSRGKAALAWCLTAAGTALFHWSGGLPAGIFYELPLACLPVLLIPKSWARALGVWLAPELSGPVDLRGKEWAQRRLNAASRAFRTLGESIQGAFRPPENDNDTAVVFDRAADRVCRSCALRGRCWQQDYNTTFTALNDATIPMMERGRAQKEDFPRYFADRCLHFPALVSAVNEELTAMLYRRQYNARIRESRQAVCRQYAQLADVLGTAAAELSQELRPDLVGDRKLRTRVAELGLDVRTAVFRDGRGLLRVEAEGPDCAALTRGNRLSDLGLLLNAPLRVEQAGTEGVSLLQQEPLMAVAGVAAQKKTGETVSGDAGTYFKRADGKLCVLLCDGMGSGPAANRESSLAVRLLEQFLQAGVEAGHALTTLSSALALRGEETGGFTTVDLLLVDLFSGEGELFKLGAAPTYVKKGREVQRLSGTSLPAGLAEGTAAGLDRFPLRLAPGDTVLMVSDGVCLSGEDGWLRKELADFSGASPKDLARDLIAHSPHEAADDRTALVVRIERRKM